MHNLTHLMQQQAAGEERKNTLLRPLSHTSLSICPPTPLHQRHHVGCKLWIQCLWCRGQSPTGLVPAHATTARRLCHPALTAVRVRAVGAPQAGMRHHCVHEPSTSLTQRLWIWPPWLDQTGCVFTRWGSSVPLHLDGHPQGQQAVV